MGRTFQIFLCRGVIAIARTHRGDVSMTCPVGIFEFGSGSMISVVVLTRQDSRVDVLTPSAGSDISYLDFWHASGVDLDCCISFPIHMSSCCM